MKPGAGHEVIARSITPLECDLQHRETQNREMRHNALASLYARGQQFEALALLNKWLSGANRIGVDIRTEIQIARGRLLWRLGLHEMARQDWQSALLLSTTASVLHEVAWLLTQSIDANPSLF